MCGIAGALSAGNVGPDVAPSLRAMQQAISHRGPDDEGLWISPCQVAAFAHARLSILDLTAAGHQPMSIAGGRFTITYNGEILNFLELRRSLEQRGVIFQTRTDTEVILRAYEADGPACVAQLRGMFAFAIWDERERTCLMARDRFGIKPFYYHSASGRLVFASELRALRASGLIPRELDAEGLYRYFRTGSVAEPKTLLRGVRCLEAGCYAVWRDGQVDIRRYCELTFAAAASCGHDDVAVTRQALLDSVEHHFISDAPVGVLLSGGVDSTALVALARTGAPRDLHTFSIALPGSSGDEGPVARRTANHFGTHHTEWAIDSTTGKKLFGQFLAASDQPSIDGLNTFAASQLARNSGMKVVLSGLGGDELFGGYPSFQDVPRLAAWHRRLSVLGPFTTALGRSIEGVSPDPRWRRIGDLLQQPPTLTTAYSAFRGIFTRREAQMLAVTYAGSMVGEWAENGDGQSSDVTPGDGVSRLELTRYMRNQLLRDADTMSMAWGLELRVPFLDNRLFEVLSAIPAGVRLQPGKRLLLEAVPEVPPWVAGQPKRGFLFPFEQWMGSEWADLFEGIARTPLVPMQSWYRKWTVFVLEHWLRMDSRGARTWT